MKKYGGRAVFVILAVIWFEIVFLGVGYAHRVNVFAWVDGDSVYVESKFAGGRPVKSGKVFVYDPQGSELLTGLTNPEGEFKFTIPGRTDLKIVLMAGQGHHGEWTIKASEMKKSTADKASDAVHEPAASNGQESAGPQMAAANGIKSDTSEIRSKELEAVIESVLDRKLRPIVKMLSDRYNKGPSVRDIAGGIGYILGLVGVAMYFQSRKK